MTWILLGASSAIARSLARQLSEDGARLILCGRDGGDLAAMAADCLGRGAESAERVTFDIRDPASFAAIRVAAERTEGPLIIAVFVGSMPDQAEIDADPSLIDGTVIDSLSGPARLLHEMAPLLEVRGGAVAGVSSVAGDRGRVTNYVYGAAKAGFTAYLSGFRNRMARHGVHVMTVKPGPVDTAMTWGLKMPLMTTPEAVATAIRKGLTRKRNVIYTAGIWRLVMTVIRAVPEPVFKKTNF
ncbi:SDR family NAD(P)-dependent oxidoreductase [Histidinibacterium lentulum]|uniref:SDR family NAD(P)-dependent oxidoreductase n=1 Tax=Histidinibacterium lentulum TaxID=2480588 RepID=A0A3N2QUZ5_9RHOB|nr:SDR family NAD(P)-dependent oxidoreductase [Histidinibacterium lentulum]ROT98977.1 SDR family NAD(P)-dependent oxidoreductase [Histidinibacterium lentulum]